MKAAQVFGFVVAVFVSARASFHFERKHHRSTPAVLSRMVAALLHFAAGIIFGALALAASLKLAGKR
jgi:hypothetical protein